MSGAPPQGRCTHTAACELFAKFSLRSSLQVWQQNYCDGQFERCARYRLSVCGKPVPQLLLPNGRELKVGWTPGGDR